MVVVAADIGGTYSRWAIVEPQSTAGFRVLDEIKFFNRHHDSFYSQLAKVLADQPDIPIEKLGLALAGPVDSDQVQLTNLPWVIDRRRVREQFGISDIRLFNDLQSAAIGTLWLDDEQLLHLNQRPTPAVGCRLVIGAGTGLGAAYLRQLADGPVCWPTEAGHIRFAPASSEQQSLLQFFEQFHKRVSYERIVSGDGLVALHHFVTGQDSPAISAAWICQRAREHDASALEVLRLWAAVLGNFVGNLATLFNPQAGIFLVGGLISKLAPWISGSVFYDAYIDQGRMQERVDRLPLRLVTDEGVGLLGAIQILLNEVDMTREVNP